MEYCKKCIMPDTRPEQVFDEQGVCDACRSAVVKHSEIDWGKRKKEFEEILSRYRNKNGSWWDCIIPISGGKDSSYQAWAMKYKYGMNPLCVNFVPCDMREIGLKNLIFLRDLGFDIVQIASNRQIYRKMVHKGFFELGDNCWPEHIGIFTTPVRLAVQYKIPLIMWGENCQFEYGGPAANREDNCLDSNWLAQFQMYGYRISDLYNEEGFDKKDLIVFEYPSDEELRNAGVTGLYLGYYEKWSGQENYRKMKELGWNDSPDGPEENAYFNYENLDCKWASGIHDYLKYLKYGYSRATDQLSILIRQGKMDRDKAIRLARTHDGIYPSKYLKDFLEYLNITEKEFNEVLDRFTNRKIFKTDDSGNFIRNKDGVPIKKNYGYDTSKEDVEMKVS